MELKLKLEQLNAQIIGLKCLINTANANLIYIQVPFMQIHHSPRQAE